MEAEMKDAANARRQAEEKRKKQAEQLKKDLEEEFRARRQAREEADRLFGERLKREAEERSRKDAEWTAKTIWNNNIFSTLLGTSGIAALGAIDNSPEKQDNNYSEKQDSNLPSSKIDTLKNPNISSNQKILLPLAAIAVAGILLKRGYKKYKSLKNKSPILSPLKFSKKKTPILKRTIKKIKNKLLV